jgi:hypothetical protein
MANKEKGEFPLTVGDRDFVLVLDFEAMVHMEDLMSTPDRVVTAHEVMFQVLSRKYPPFKHARAVLWAALQRKHPEMKVTDAQALIDEMGGTEYVVEALLGTYKAAKPDNEDTDGRPQAARQASTGGPTTSTRGGSKSPRTPSGA